MSDELDDLLGVIREAKDAYGANLRRGSPRGRAIQGTVRRRLAKVRAKLVEIYPIALDDGDPDADLPPDNDTFPREPVGADNCDDFSEPYERCEDAWGR